MQITVIAAAALATAQLASPQINDSKAVSPANTVSAAGKWVLDNDENTCSLSRTLDAASSTTLVLRTFPGSDKYDILLTSRAWPDGPLGGNKPATLELSSGARYVRQGRVVEIKKVDQRVIAFGDLPSSLLTDFASSSGFGIVRAGARIGSYSISGSAAAVRVLRSCEDATLLAWGADPAGLSPGATRPQPLGNPDDWLSTVKTMTGGNPPIDLRLRLTIDTQGKVQNCEIIRTRHSPVDGLACIFLAAKYEPARDATGRPVKSIAVYHAHWD